MSRLDELKRTYAEMGEEIEKLEKEEARKPWVPEQGERAWWLNSNGAPILTKWCSGMQAFLAQGRIAPDNERGRTWLEAIAAWERALKESYDERAKGEDGKWWYWYVSHAHSVSDISLFFFGLVFRRTKEEAEQDGERWGKRLAQGRGF